MPTTQPSPLFSYEFLYGYATTTDMSGVVNPYVGTAYIWVQPPGGTVAKHSITCSSPNGAWSYLNYNNVAGTWTAVLRVPGTVATASLDYQWEVESSVAPEN